MPTIVNFKGRRVVEPGVYAQIKSGIPAKPSTASFGDLLIIDTGKGKAWGGGSGINGTFANGIESVYSFQDVDDFKAFVRGGLFYDLADYIFNPIDGASGPETVSIVKAATTTPAEIEYAFTEDANGGTVKFLVKSEGEGANGFTDETLGTATLRFTPSTVQATEVLSVAVAAVVIGTFTCTSNSMSAALTGIMNAINVGTSGYKAKIQGTALVLTSKPNGGDPTALAITAPGDVTLVGSAAFSGYVAGTKISTGYGAEMVQSDEDDTKYKIRFFEGGYAGDTPGGNSISGLTKQETVPFLLSESVEFDNIDTLIQWALNDFNFNKVFKVADGYDIIGTGAIHADDFTKYENINLAKNGTSVYNAADLDKVLEDIREMQNSFILSDCYGAEARGVENLKILSHIQDDAEFDKWLIIGGGADASKFDTGNDSSIEIAKFFNTTSVIVVHSGETRNPDTVAEEKLPAIYHAANVAGILGGLEPQVPGTFKAIKIKKFNHPLGLKQREKALINGVLHNRTIPGMGNVINQSINTLQKNTRLINPDGTSPEISIMRIGGQLNKELILNMRPLFVGNNWGMASPADVKTYVEGYLFGRTVQTNQDNLILSFKNVTVRLVEDGYDIKYGYVANGPINKMFVTGFMLDANLNA